MECNIGTNIKMFRTKLGLSQDDVAQYCMIKREVLSYYETGQREVSLLHLEKIAEFMGVEMDVLLQENPSDSLPDLALAFRADEVSPSDRDKIAAFKRIVKNYLKMKLIDADGVKA